MSLSLHLIIFRFLPTRLAFCAVTIAKSHLARALTTRLLVWRWLRSVYSNFFFLPLLTLLFFFSMLVSVVIPHSWLKCTNCWKTMVSSCCRSLVVDQVGSMRISSGKNNSNFHREISNGEMQGSVYEQICLSRC